MLMWPVWLAILNFCNSYSLQQHLLGSEVQFWQQVQKVLYKSVSIAHSIIICSQATHGNTAKRNQNGQRVRHFLVESQITVEIETFGFWSQNFTHWKDPIFIQEILAIPKMGNIANFTFTNGAKSSLEHFWNSKIC